MYKILESLHKDLPINKEKFTAGLDHTSGTVNPGQPTSKWQEEVCKKLALYDRRGWETKLKNSN